MAISQERYVEIASGVAGATVGSMQKLVGRVFTDNEALEPNKLYSMRNAEEVTVFFGQDSEEAKVARMYFSYVSPLPAARPQELQFYLHPNTNRQAQLIGSNNIEAVEDVVAIEDNEIQVSINGRAPEEFTVDLTEAVSYSDVARALSTAISLDVRYEINQLGQGQFTVNGDFISLSIQGAIATAIGLDMGRYVEGKTAQKLSETIAESTDLDSFGSIIVLTQNSIDDLKAAAELVATYNVRYQLYIDVPEGQEEQYSEAFIDTASAGLIYGKGGYRLSALPAAIMAATDYDRRNATVNYMFRSPNITIPVQVTKDSEANELDPLRINYYGQTKSNGVKISFFQRGFLCGKPTAPLDMGVHANEQWLKAKITQEWFTLLVSQSKVPANRDGAAMGKMVIEGVVEQALYNGTILRGKELTTNQKIAISELTSDYDAWHQVYDTGYWSEVDIVEYTGEAGIAEYKLQYTLIYAKGDAVRKVTGSHNLI